MSNEYSEETLQEKAKDKLRDMLQQKCAGERWEPVMRELHWVLGGRRNPDEHQKLLPEYCYEIIDLWMRTIFQAFPTFQETVTCSDQEALSQCKSVDEAKELVTIDWAKMGSVLGMGLRGLRFFDKEAAGQIQEAGLNDLSEDGSEELGEMVAAEDWLQKVKNEFESVDPGKSTEEILKEKIEAAGTSLGSGLVKWPALAYQWGPKAMTELHEGMAKGSSGFLDEEGELRGEKRLKLCETYQFLLMAWPEIDEMIKANPPKRMMDLWNWLSPFSYAGWIEIEDFDQLVSLARSVELKLKKPGAPRKLRES